MIDHLHPHEPIPSAPERLMVAAEQAERQFMMTFARINTFPPQSGFPGLMLVGVEPPLPDRIPSEGLYYADEEINPGKPFVLRLGSTGVMETFHAIDVSPASRVA